MITQQEFVEGCQSYYAENWLEPGNPEDGIWHDCHYPTPACLGGTETVKLLKEHHAVQGVLQSEEFGHPCILGWEADYLKGKMLTLYKKWHSYRSAIWTKKVDRQVMVDRINKVRHLAHEKLRKSVTVSSDSGTTVYGSMKDAANSIGVSRQLITKWLYGQSNTYTKYGVTVAWA